MKHAFDAANIIAMDEIEENDVATAGPEFLMVDSDHEKDEEIDIL